MVVNPNNFQLMFFGLKQKQKLHKNINPVKILEKKHVMLLGVEIDSKLKFDKHVKAPCQKFNKKTGAFTRVSIYISRVQALSSYNVVILSNFNYCPLVCVFCNKSVIEKLHRAHKRTLWILYNDYNSSLQSVLRRSNSYTILVKNIQKLMTEVYKSLNDMIVSEFHEIKYVKYELRQKNLSKLPNVKTTSCGVESLSFRGSFLWNTLDDNIKQEPTLTRFEYKIKSWAGDQCTCNIC